MIKLPNRNLYTIFLIHCFYEYFEIETPHLISLLAGIEKSCRSKNINLIQASMDEIFDESHPIFKADGILIMGWMPKEKFDYIRRITSKIVYMGGCLDSNRFDCVSTDLGEATKNAIDYLIDLGHKGIGFIGGSIKFYYPEYDSIDIREQAFRNHISLKGLLNEKFISIGKFSGKSGYQMACEFIKKRNMSTAFFVASDTLAFGVLSAFREYGIRMPEDISIISCDDSPAAKVTVPPLTTMRIYTEVMAEAAVDLLIKRFNKDVDINIKVIIPTKLIVRGSCATMPS